MKKSWENEIEVLISIKKEIKDKDINEIWEFNLPQKAAADDEIQKIELKLGYTLDEAYVSFLKIANGWKAINQAIDLFGTNELLDSEQMNYAQILLKTLSEDGVLHASGFDYDELLPIAVSRYDTDLFVIAKNGSNCPGIIIWFAGYEVERYDNFEEFFRAIVEYNRLNIQYLNDGLMDI